MFFERFDLLAKQNNSNVNTVAKKLGVSSGSVTSWKNGTVPNSAIVSKLAQHFNVTTDYLLGLSEDPTPQILEVPKALKQVMVAFEGVDELSQAQVDKIAEYTKFILSQPD